MKEVGGEASLQSAMAEVVRPQSLLNCFQKINEIARSLFGKYSGGICKAHALVYSKRGFCAGSSAMLRYLRSAST